MSMSFGFRLERKQAAVGRKEIMEEANNKQKEETDVETKETTVTSENNEQVEYLFI